MDSLKLSVRQIKSVLQQRRVDASQCVERSELETLVRTTAPAPRQPETLKLTVGGLNVHVLCTDACKPVGVVVVLVHGYGSNGADLFGIAQQITPEINRSKNARNGVSSILFVAPDAPTSAAGTGGSGFEWWPIDMQGLIQSAFSGQLRDALATWPDGFHKSRDALLELVGELKRMTRLNESSFHLAGFSQGATLLLDTFFRFDKSPRSLHLWSGFVPGSGDPQWTDEAFVSGRRTPEQQTFIMHTHGTRDMLIPVAIGLDVKKILERNGFEITSLSFEGDHTLPYEAMTTLRDQILSHLAVLERDREEGGDLGRE